MCEVLPLINNYYWFSHLILFFFPPSLWGQVCFYVQSKIFKISLFCHVVFMELDLGLYTEVTLGITQITEL